MSQRLTATVLIPSYRRPDTLLRCLDAVLAGERLPAQVVVVLRDTDTDSHRRLREWLRSCPHAELVELAEVVRPGQVAATNAGLKLARGDVVCFIDDDTEPEPDWLARVMAHYDAPDVVGVGGRDVVHIDGEVVAEPQAAVGRLTWFGRMIGNHHQPGFDEPVEVQHLKGANMSYRRGAVTGFDPHIRGAHLTDTDASLSARSGGGRLIYDPAAVVHHYPAPRTGGFSRASESAAEIYADAHDWAYVMLKHLPASRRVAFWLFALLVGQGRRYGLLRMLVRFPTEGLEAARRWWHTTRGLLGGDATWRSVCSDGADGGARE